MCNPHMAIKPKRWNHRGFTTMCVPDTHECDNIQTPIEKNNSLSFHHTLIPSPIGASLSIGILRFVKNIILLSLTDQSNQ